MIPAATSPTIRSNATVSPAVKLVAEKSKLALLVALAETPVKALSLLVISAASRVVASMLTVCVVGVVGLVSVMVNI